jgi:hypothetical protein
MNRRAYTKMGMAALVLASLPALAQQPRADAGREQKGEQKGAAPGFPASTELAGTPLVLNGAGTRYRAVFKVYDIALYLPRKANTAEQVIAMPGPKKLACVARRELNGGDLGVAFMRSLKDNTAPAVLNRQLVAANRLVDIFSGKNKLAEGDEFGMEYVPGKGTSFIFDGKSHGAPVGDAEFFAAVLRIWLGQVPPDWKLKDALLGA